MLRKSFSFVVAGGMLFLLAVFIAADASLAQAESTGQLQYWVSMEKDLASVRAQQGDFKEGPAAMFERQPATGRWQRLEQAGRKGSGAPAPRTFGYAMAIDGDYAIVGAEWHDGFKGAAYIFKRKGDGWTEVQKLSPPDLGRFDHFGGAVSISGDYAVVAATWHDLLRGAAYVFKREGKEWVQQDKLTAADARTDDRFGRTVRIDGSEITISNASGDLQAAGTSLAYRFRRSGDTWVEGQKTALPVLEESGAYAGELLIASEISSDLLALAEIVGKDTETPPLLAPTHAEHYFIRGDVYEDGTVDGNDWEFIWMYLEMDEPVPCEDAADVNDDGAIDWADLTYLGKHLEGLGPPPPHPFPDPGLDMTADGLSCGFTMIATDDAFEDRVEMVWTSAGLDAIIYRIERDGTLISLASSEDSLYADKTGDPAVTYTYCVKVVDNMDGGELDSDCDDGSRIIFPPEHISPSDGDFDRFVRLTWDDMSSIEEGYQIRRRRGDSSDEWVVIHTTSPNVTVFDDTGAVQEKRTDPIGYWYELIALDADENESKPDSGWGWRSFIVPPAEVSASDGEYGGFVRITWIDQAENEDGYRIWRRLASQPDYSLIGTTPDTIHFYEDYTAEDDSEYIYCVATFDTVVITEGDTAWESPLRCDRGGTFDLPRPAYVMASDYTYDDCVEITWDDTSDLEDGFTIFRNGQEIGSTQAGATLYKDFTAEADSCYSYCVLAFTEESGSSDLACDDGCRAMVLPPFDVQASDGTREDRVDITWKSSSTTAVLFKILREGTFIKSVSQGTRSYSDYGGMAGEGYRYIVVAVTDTGVHAESEPDSGRRELKPPTPVTASDEEYEEKIVISWVDNSWIENGYRVFREDTDSHESDSVFMLGRNRTSLTDYSAVPGVTYKYTVEAFDTVGAGDEELMGFSAPASDVGRRVLLPPTNVRASDGKFEKRVEITWEDNSQAEDGYKIFRNGSQVGETSDNFTFFTDSYMIEPGAVKEYSVIAFDMYGISAPASDNGSTAILAPGSFNASDTYKDRVVLTWVDLSEVEDSYVISCDGTDIHTAGPNVTSYTDYPELPGKTYRYCIRAVAGSQSSEPVCDDGQFFEPPFVTTETYLDVGLVASDAHWADQFGWSVAIDGDVAIIGAPEDHEGGDYAGAAYIFTRQSDGKWTETKKLFVAGQAWDFFGRSVAIDGDVAIVGAPGDDGPNYWDRGSAYILTRDDEGTWDVRTKIEPSPVHLGYLYGDHFYAYPILFGSSVAISGDFAIVGAPGSYETWGPDVRWDSVGVAYIIKRNADGTWPALANIGVGGGYLYQEYNLFGSSVAIDGNVAVVGAKWEDNPGDTSGSAYIFELIHGVSWQCRGSLRPSDGQAGDQFGSSVAVSGGTAMVGAVNADVAQKGDAGAAYVFARAADGWWEGNETQKLVASDFGWNYHFGSSVAMIGGNAIVGSWGPPTGKGSAYLFTRAPDGVWLQMSKLRPVSSNPTVEGDYFGFSVALSDDWGMVGAYKANFNKGAAYLLGIAEPPGAVAASDGTLNSRVRIQWEDRSLAEDGFYISRDGEVIATLLPDVEVYDDLEAQPGRTYKYGVQAFNLAGYYSEPVYDFGWRPPNGNVTGRVTTSSGAGVEGISVGLDPQPIRALLLDGNGGHARIPDPEAGFAFSQSTSFTIEAWIKYSGNGGSGTEDGAIIAKTGTQSYAFLLTNLRTTTGQPGRLHLDIFEGCHLTSKRDDLNDGTWHHVAIVRDVAPQPRELRLYLDGSLDTLVQQAGDLGDTSNTEDVTLGVAFYPESWFGGQIDEVRIWKVARDSLEIKATRTKQLTGDEEGLVGYWPLDEDGTGVITDLTEGAHYGTLRDGAYWTDNAAPMDVSARTDIEGNYALANVRYGQETTFQVTPSGEQRQFQPAFRFITLSTESPVENQVDFVETTSFGVCGVVRYENTDCFVQNVEIHVDGQLLATTDKNGKFSVGVSKGDHWFKPVLAGHTFAQVMPEGPPDPCDSIPLTIDGDTPGVDFVDQTLRTVSGVVSGGCGKPIGEVTITFRSENSCMVDSIRKDTGNLEEDSTYSIQLPPQSYFATGTVDPYTVPPGMSKSDLLKFFDNLGDRMIDLAEDDTTLDFIYRAPLLVTIEGFDSYRTDCEELWFGDKRLPDFLPIIPQGEVVSCTIRVKEYYGIDEAGDSVLCSVDSAAVIIYDEIFDQEDTPVELVVKDGEAYYKTFASTPSLVAGRLDSQGNDRSFQKAIRARVLVEGRTPVTATEWVLVTGHVAGEGADFFTATSNPFPLYVLRDPPGDQSYAYLEKGYTSVATIDYGNVIKSWSTGVNLAVEFGVDMEFFIGLGAGKIFEVQVQGTAETNFLKTDLVSKEWKSEITLTTKETFSTSPDELFVGGGGDVFVGAGLNFIFAKVGVVDVQECNVLRSTSLAFQPNSIATTFSYTQEYIQDVLIPQLESTVNYYESMPQPDSAGMFRSMRDNWVTMLAINDSLKQDAILKKNRSFSAGADFEFFFESDTTRSYTETRTLTFDNSVEAGMQISIEGFGLTFGIPFSTHVEQVAGHTDTSGTSSHALGYVLSDNDIGDHFTVDIKEDGRYPSPVFDVLAGVSSCPHEPWPDPKDGKARMWSRDAPGLDLGGDPVLEDVPPDEAAAFTLTLSNESQTEETREYVLREITTSNPGGAIIKANGNPIGNGLSYFISGDPLNNSNQVTLTVERGPTKYRYANLALMLYPPCDDNISSTVTFGVNFKSPCSDITLYRPKPGWKVSLAELTEYINLCDYELAVSETVSVQKIGAQRRLLGTGREGPGEWKEIFNVTGEEIDPEEIESTWNPGVDVKDGVYELRGYTDCGDGNIVYSNVSVGTIDRNAPQVFGTPQPADGELSLGEDISITFNEPIDPDSIRADRFTLEYVGGPTIDVDWVCDGSTIIIVPDFENPDDPEGQQLEATVTGIYDLVGNAMEGAATWSFTVRQSVFTWREASITQEVALGAPGTITAELVNGSDGTANFVIASKPVWITEVSPDTGNLPPGHTQTVTFTTDSLLTEEGGPYNGVVDAQSECGSAELAINLTVSCHAPVWSFDRGAYQYTMTIVASISNVLPQYNNRVAAFVGNQLRGVADVHPSNGLAFLTVYSNRESGETVRFEVWSHSQCKLYKYTDQRYAFVSDEVYGSPENPESITAQDDLPGDVQEIPLSAGWNWFSSNVVATDMGVNSVLSNLTPALGDIIRSKTDSATFDATMSWSGLLTELNNVSCYMIRLSEPGIILQEGTPFPVGTEITVVSGWNWISYLPQDSLLVADALADLNPDWLNGEDVIKSQTAFAQWSEAGQVWFGTLEYMKPGMGYKLHLTAEHGSFTYNDGVGTVPPWPGTDEDEEQSAPIAEAEPGWSIDRNAFQYNMTVAAVLDVEGDECRSENEVIAAFVDGECRGMAQPMYLAAVDRYVAFLMIYSNSVSGETVEFQAFVPGVRAVYNVAEAITYEADGSVGSIGKPLILSTEGIAFEIADNIPTRYSLSQNYPNPFNPMTTVEYGLPEQSHATIEVFNVLGQRVRTLVSGIQPAGRHSVVWDGKDDQGRDVGSGIYFYRLRAGAFSESKKMVILK